MRPSTLAPGRRLGHSRMVATTLVKKTERRRGFEDLSLSVERVRRSENERERVRRDRWTSRQATYLGSFLNERSEDDTNLKYE